MNLLAQVPVTPDQQNTLITWILNQGPWAFFTAVMLLLAYWGGRAFFIHLAVPLKDAAIDHLKGVTASMTKLGDTLDVVQQKLSHVDDKTTVIMEELDTIESKINTMPSKPIV